MRYKDFVNDVAIFFPPHKHEQIEDIGREIVANVVALGAMIGLTGVVSKEAGEEAVLRKVPAAFKDLNKKAYNLGYEKAKELLN